jgi:hypothetical protein
VTTSPSIGPSTPPSPPLAPADASPGVHVHPGARRHRQTPPPAGRRFGAALADAASLAGGALGLALGSRRRDVTAATSAALIETPSPAGSPGSTASPAQPTPGTSLPTALPGTPVSDPWATEGVDYLRLQERIGAETRRFTTLSNVMKARHDAAQTAINNIG